MSTETWTDGFGTWHARAATPQEAGKAIRAQLLERGLIGKYTPVTVEPVSWEVNHYVEAWEEPEDEPDDEIFLASEADDDRAPNLNNSRFF